MASNRPLSSLDFNVELSKKNSEPHNRVKQIVLKQRRCSNQNHKEQNLFNDHCNGRRNGHPSIETTGIPPNSVPDEAAGPRYPQFEEKKLRISSIVPTSSKQSTIQSKVEQKLQSEDSFDSFRFLMDLKPKSNRQTQPNIFIEGMDLLDNPLDLSLSIIKLDAEAHALNERLIEKPVLKEALLEYELSFDQLIDEELQFVRGKECLISQGLLNLNLSRIQEKNQGYDDFDANSIDALILSDVVLNLSLSDIEIEKEIINQGEVSDILTIPATLRDLNLSLIQPKISPADRLELESMIALLDEEFSLEIELSVVKLEDNGRDNSETDPIDDWLLTDA